MRYAQNIANITIKMNENYIKTMIKSRVKGMKVYRLKHGSTTTTLPVILNLLFRLRK